jgi:hypothetical protein
MANEPETVHPRGEGLDGVEELAPALPHGRTKGPKPVRHHARAFHRTALVSLLTLAVSLPPALVLVCITAINAVRA